MMQEMWNGPPGFRPTKSAPSSPAKPLGVSRTRSDTFHVTHKVPVGDTPYVRAKNVQLVDKDPERAIPLFWAAINAGDRVDSALKDMAIVMKQQNRAEEAIEAIKSLRSRCSDQAQESLDNILLDLYKGWPLMGSEPRRRDPKEEVQVSVEQEATRLLGNLGWALMQQNNYIEAEEAYRRALLLAPDNNKMCNLGICLMKQGRIGEAKETLRRVKPAVADGPRGVDSHLKAYERAQQMLRDLESEMMNRGGDRVEQSKLFDAFLGSSAIWQPQPCKEQNLAPFSNAQPSSKLQDDAYADENANSNIITSRLPQRSAKPGIGATLVNSLNIDAPPFYSSKFAKDSSAGTALLPESLKRTRSGNVANLEQKMMACTEPENKVRKQSISPEKTGDKWADLLPDSKDFEEAIIAAVLGPSYETTRKTDDKRHGDRDDITQRKVVDKRLKVFQDITASLSPKA
ncbi:protein POLLENLESS 3-LIKE 2 [Sesamum angolense]|uniref:Protein POLLENLESS 3-LIKE 2 n=1 Tax=Sesamum angolense TaxID=2727404 RepID=A0AAE2BQA5_9LAMI|nr:protein POLLENLESS 3-LIKE 2 [Sesamum angolense]